ncbi:RTA1-like protein [Mycena maculata]|uniref:RTA1-like protein n=1 Tax=Mycena maculata TaxID=230809 RepID=A0AAD7IBD8_9AGAR|nr:RTA1-like protein [Mycena maculata]
MLSPLSIRDNNTTAADDAQYGYVPSQTIAIIFLALFGLSTLLHYGQAMYYRVWWLLPTATLCGIGELIGWSGRLWSSISPTASDPYMIQVSTTIIAPTPLLAASFMILSRVVLQLGTSYSRLTPKWFTIIFLPCDLTALVVQGVGGGIASAASDLAGANVGANIMLGGITFQFLVIIVFTLVAGDFLNRYLRDQPLRTDGSTRGALTARLKLMLSALAFSTLVLIVRSVYRIVELSTGWEGVVIHTQVYFDVFDAAMVVLAIFTLNVAHPGRLLLPPVQDRGKPADTDMDAVELLRGANRKGRGKDLESSASSSVEAL